MTTEERTGAIDAPPDRVWDVLADYGAIASWAPNVDHSCLLTERADGVGAVRGHDAEALADRAQQAAAAAVVGVLAWCGGGV